MVGTLTGKLVYATLSQLGSSVLWVRLVRDKKTILAKSLWPALLSVACSRRAWQLDGLFASGNQLLHLVDAASTPLRLDEVMLRGAQSALRELARERRLLVVQPRTSLTLQSEDIPDSF